MSWPLTDVQKICPRCGTEAEIPGPRKVAEMAAELPVAPQLRADDAVLAARLKRCASCGDLREGVLCAVCGCFVLFRARIKDGYCPRPEGSLWE